MVEARGSTIAADAVAAVISSESESATSFALAIGCSLQSIWRRKRNSTTLVSCAWSEIPKNLDLTAARGGCGHVVEVPPVSKLDETRSAKGAPRFLDARQRRNAVQRIGDFRDFDISGRAAEVRCRDRLE